MKVLHAYNQHRGGGGSDNSTRTTIDVLRMHGVDVQVFTRSSEDLPRGLPGRFQAAANAIYAGGSVRKFAGMLDSFQPDVVHVHEVFPLVSPWILPLCTRRGIPVAMTCVDYRMTCPIVTHLHDGKICTLCAGGHEYWAILKNCRRSLPESLVVALYNAMVRKLALFSRHVGQFIAPSDFTRSWLIEHAGIPADKIITVSPIVQLPTSGVDPAFGQYVAYAGRFTPEKGMDTLLAAIRLSELPFRLSHSHRSMVTVPVPSEVEVFITRDKDDLNAFFRGARMFVFPSIWFEAFGLVAAEAMAHGVPVLASRLGAMQALIQDGVDGLLFDPGDARDLSEKVRRLWDDPELCRRLGRAARQKALSQWSAEQHAQRLKNVYENLRERQCHHDRMHVV
jgi:glycosyltransferase involved in cell wall biosynthesis